MKTHLVTILILQILIGMSGCNSGEPAPDRTARDHQPIDSTSTAENEVIETPPQVTESCVLPDGWTVYDEVSVAEVESIMGQTGITPFNEEMPDPTIDEPELIAMSITELWDTDGPSREFYEFDTEEYNAFHGIVNSLGGSISGPCGGYLDYICGKGVETWQIRNGMQNFISLQAYGQRYLDLTSTVRRQAVNMVMYNYDGRIGDRDENDILTATQVASGRDRLGIYVGSFVLEDIPYSKIRFEVVLSENSDSLYHAEIQRLSLPQQVLGDQWTVASSGMCALNQPCGRGRRLEVVLGARGNTFFKISWHPETYPDLDKMETNISLASALMDGLYD